MPKKTKKEKLLALYHKKLSLLENRQTTSPVTTPIKSSSQPATIKRKEPVDMTESAEERQFNRFFLSDLKKSLILITIIIGLELSIYAMHLVK